MDSRLCEHCGAMIEPEDRFCLRCGAPIQKRKPEDGSAYLPHAAAFSPWSSSETQLSGNRTVLGDIHNQYLLSDTDTDDGEQIPVKVDKLMVTGVQQPLQDIGNTITSSMTESRENNLLSDSWEELLKDSSMNPESSQMASVSASRDSVTLDQDSSTIEQTTSTVDQDKWNKWMSANMRSMDNEDKKQKPGRTGKRKFFFVRS